MQRVPMSQKILIITALWLFTAPSIWAQQDYRNGYIVTNQMDTIYGLIDYRGAARNAKICSFKRLKTDPSTDYTPMDILAYRFIDSKLYISKSIDNSDSLRYVFLECLFMGIANLYYYRDENKTDHYYVEKEEQFFALEIFESEVMVSGVRKWKTEKPYVGKLKTFFDIWELNEEIDRVTLDHKSLIRIFKEYHSYLGAEGKDWVIFEKKEPRMAFRFGPIVGADFTTPAVIYYDGEKHRPTSLANLSVGANFNIWIPRINEKFFIQLQAIYTKYYFFDSYETPTRTIDLHVKSDVLQLGLAFKYEYPKGRCRPTWAVGATSLFLPNGTIKEVAYRYAFDEEVRPMTQKTDYPSKIMVGFSFTPGIHYYLSKERIVFIQAFYQQCYAVINPPNKIYSFGISAGLFFTKR